MAEAGPLIVEFCQLRGTSPMDVCVFFFASSKCMCIYFLRQIVNFGSGWNCEAFERKMVLVPRWQAGGGRADAQTLPGQETHPAQPEQPQRQVPVQLPSSILPALSTLCALPSLCLLRNRDLNTTSPARLTLISVIHTAPITLQDSQAVAAS